MRSRRILLLCASLLSLAACAAAQPEVDPTPETLNLFGGRDLRVILKDGRVDVLRAAMVDGDSLVGQWRAGGSGPERAAVAVADIRSVQPVTTTRRRGEPSAGFIVGAVVVTAVTVAAATLAILVVSFRGL